MTLIMFSSEMNRIEEIDPNTQCWYCHGLTVLLCVCEWMMFIVNEWIIEWVQLFLFCNIMQGVNAERKECMQSARSVCEEVFFDLKLRRDSGEILYAECAYWAQGVCIETNLC